MVNISHAERQLDKRGIFKVQGAVRVVDVFLMQSNRPWQSRLEILRNHAITEIKIYITTKHI